jgi:hypothetical protein
VLAEVVGDFSSMALSLLIFASRAAASGDIVETQNS